METCLAFLAVTFLLLGSYVVTRMVRSLLGLFIQPRFTGRVTKYAVSRVGHRHRERWSELFSWMGFLQYFRDRLSGQVRPDLCEYSRVGSWERAAPRYEEESIWATSDGRWRIVGLALCAALVLLAIVPLVLSGSR